MQDPALRPAAISVSSSKEHFMGTSSFMTRSGFRLLPAGIHCSWMDYFPKRSASSLPCSHNAFFPTYLHVNFFLGFLAPQIFVTLSARPLEVSVLDLMDITAENFAVTLRTNLAVQHEARIHKWPAKSWNECFRRRNRCSRKSQQ